MTDATLQLKKKKSFKVMNRLRNETETENEKIVKDDREEKFEKNRSHRQQHSDNSNRDERGRNTQTKGINSNKLIRYFVIYCSNNDYNKNKRINTWTIPHARYSEPFGKWTREKLKQMDPRTGKLMTMHKALHPRDDVDRLYLSRKKGGKGLVSIEFINFMLLITAIRNDTHNTMDNRMTITRKQKLKEKTLWTF